MTLYIALLFLLGSSLLAAIALAVQRKVGFISLEWVQTKEKAFFFKNVLLFFFKEHTWEGLRLFLSTSKHLLKLAYAAVAFTYIFESYDPHFAFTPLALTLLSVAIPSLLCDYIFMRLVQTFPGFPWHLLSPIASCYLFLCLPLSAPMIYLTRPLLRARHKEKSPFSYLQIKDKLHELLQESELSTYLDSTQKQFILSMISFKERIAREVMVPRINVFSLPHDTSIQEAAEHFIKEGYSRIPVYKESVDDIIGVLFYKDLLSCYKQGNVEHSIQKLVKPVIYTPETKKISQLLQDFRLKQIHMAIIVDEWGGTEGIVTIEDILEEIVGEIADEYDTDELAPFSPLPGGSFLVDAKMSIIDIHEELGIDIPQSPEYDTIGGYIFYRAGSIPSQGWKIHHDDFDLEVLSSTERAIEKIKLSKGS